MAKAVSRKTQRAPKDETKAQRFTRVVTPRVGKAIKAIQVIGYCAGSTYEYNEKQVQEILVALTNSFHSLEDQFAKKQTKQDSFSFTPTE